MGSGKARRTTVSTDRSKQKNEKNTDDHYDGLPLRFVRDRIVR